MSGNKHSSVEDIIKLSEVSSLVMQKVDEDEKPFAKHDLSSISQKAQTPHSVPPAEITTHDEVESEHIREQPMVTSEVVGQAISPLVSHKENKVTEEDNSSSTVAHELLQHQFDDDDDESTVSEEDEAAVRIQQRFNDPAVLHNIVHSMMITLNRN